MLFWLLILINLCPISTINIGYLNQRLYTPQPANANASYTYHYTTTCKECLCYAFTLDTVYAIINCITNTSSCLFYANFTSSYSFESNMDTSVYLFQTPPTPTMTGSITSMKSTNALTSTSMQTTVTSMKQITSSMSPCVGSKIITFDDIINASILEGSVPTYYNCFKWINGWYLNITTLSLSSGYRRALTSGVYVVLNRNGTSMNMTTTTLSFDVRSFVTSSAYYDRLHLSILGIRGLSTIAYSQDILVNTTSGKLVSLNWSNLTTLNFQSYYYQSSFPVQNLTGIGYQFALDSLNITLH